MFWINYYLLSSQLNDNSGQFTVTMTHIVAERTTGADHQKLNFLINVILPVQYSTRHLLLRKPGRFHDSSLQL
jgi:hypothetical protein